MTLSVIVPVYNTEKYLRRCLDSILAQTRLPDEIICVNDGSTDGSQSILEEYTTKNQLIKVISKENGGLVSARKAGIKVATSDRVTYVDSDDYIELDMYENLMSYAEKYNADLVTSGFIRDYGENMIAEEEGFESNFYEKKDYKTHILNNLISIDSFYKCNILISLCNKIFKREKLLSVQMSVDDRISMGEDDAVIYPYLFSAKNIYISGKKFYHYCIRQDSICGTKDEMDEERIEVLLKHIKKVFKANEKEFPILQKQYKLFAINFKILRNVNSVLKSDGDILYPFGKVKKEDKTLLYGAGSLGLDIFDWIKNNGYNVIGIVDKNVSNNSNKIIPPDDLINIDFDKLIISASNANVVESISRDLKKLGIEENKVLRIDADLIKRAGV